MQDLIRQKQLKQLLIGLQQLLVKKMQARKEPSLPMESKRVAIYKRVKKEDLF